MIEQLVAKYRAVIQFPGLTAARVVQQEGTQSTIISAWSQRCLEKGKNTKFSQTHIISDLQVIHIPPIDTSTELLSAFSPSGKSRAVLRESSNSESNSKKQHLEIWSDNCMSQLIDLTLLDQHGDVYTSGEFSCLEWSSCEKKLLYAAEKKQPKAEPFYPNKSKDKEKNSTEPDDKLPKKGEEYVFRQDWGETLAGRHQPVLCVCELPGGTVSVLAGVPDSLSVGQGLWVPDGIVAVGWPHTPRRIGIVYCTNRPSYVFHLSSKGTFTKLSGEGLAAHSPRLSPQGDYLVWLQRPANGPHHAAHQLVKQVWGALPSTVVDIVQTSSKCSGGQSFYGLFCQSLPDNCFSDNNTLLLSTGQETVVRSYIVHTDVGAVHQIKQTEGSLSVLDVSGGLVVLAESRVDTPTALLVGRLSADKTAVDDIRPVLQRPPAPALNTAKLHVFNLQAPGDDLVKDFNAIYYGPVDGPSGSIPLILWPHGGPHAMFFQTYSVFNQFFISAGFATLQVNYRGSTGAGQASVDWLPGRVGDSDVKDCHQAALAALQHFNCLDRHRVVLYGGSHGGFLVTHLSGQYPDFYKAVVARNPVIDVPSILFVSDIPDWAVVEAGYTYTGKEQVEMTPEFLTKLRSVSPIQYAAAVKAPTLLNIGKKDLRVPPSQGTLYYHTLNTYNIPCKMNLYEDNHSLSTVPVDIDATINAVLWFQQHIAANTKKD